MTDMIYYYLLNDNINKTDLIDDFILELYNNKAKLITVNQINKLNLPENYNEQVIEKISKYEERVPLYDVKFNHIFLIYKQNIYPRFYYDNYRFIDEKLINKMKKKDDKENLRFISFYDIKILNETYHKIFYQSFTANTLITSCQRPSFYSGVSHISPYYKLNELYFLAYDWNISSPKTINEDEINKICDKVVQYDISHTTLINHQMYIYNSKHIGLVKHYSLFGSYYINKYLRKMKYLTTPIEDNSIPRNLGTENQIKMVINLIKNAPEFDTNHVVYRFIENDNFISHLKINDVYIDDSFMSTTRNPFYYKENYGFGFILLKITIPKGKKGVGLCIESYSNFPNEEEIILLPTSKYRLDKIIDTKENIAFHGNFNLELIKKYEMTLIGNNLTENVPNSYIPKIKEVSLLKILEDETFNYIDISERLKHFKNHYLNENSQFITSVAGKKYQMTMSSYNSENIYKPYFYYEIDNGIMITCYDINYGNISLIIEYGIEMHVNYYFKFSVSDYEYVIDLNNQEWINWLCLLAFILGSRSVVIHSTYALQYNKNDTDEQKQIKTKYTFSNDIYQYMKNKTKMFTYDYITPSFDYSELDYLFKIPADKYILQTDKNELHRFLKISGVKTMGDFYIYIIENMPVLWSELENKMKNIFEDVKNPFINTNYVIDAWLYLYNSKSIKTIPNDKEFVIKPNIYKHLISDIKIPKFKNRIREWVEKHKNVMNV
jgi:hypothetical protein